jgi:predicted phosphodiesterase
MTDHARRLTEKISYDSKKDLLVHVGDLVAKGEKNEEVLEWMDDYSIMGVRGNHDQPVCLLSLSI